jgi:DNA-binding NarL/FixJ family response regulator
LSGSGDRVDITECFRGGAAGYMVKPSDHKQLIDMIRTIHAYWTLSESPQQDV